MSSWWNWICLLLWFGDWKSIANYIFFCDQQTCLNGQLMSHKIVPISLIEVRGFYILLIRSLKVLPLVKSKPLLHFLSETLGLMLKFSASEKFILISCMFSPIYPACVTLLKECHRWTLFWKVHIAIIFENKQKLHRQEILISFWPKFIHKFLILMYVRILARVVPGWCISGPNLHMFSRLVIWSSSSKSLPYVRM
jgi:hypothetical protein